MSWYSKSPFLQLTNKKLKKIAQLRAKRELVKFLLTFYQPSSKFLGQIKFVALLKIKDYSKSTNIYFQSQKRLSKTSMLYLKW